MSKKIIKLSIYILIVIELLSFIGCSKGNDEPNTQTNSEEALESDGLMLTYEELSQYNGEEGKTMYIAYEGKIYDVSGMPKWKSGSHNGVKAGTDITDKISKAPHGTSKLDELKIVGEIIE